MFMSQRLVSSSSILAHQEVPSGELRAAERVTGLAGQLALIKGEARDAASASLKRDISFLFAKGRLVMMALRLTMDGIGVEKVGLESHSWSRSSRKAQQHSLHAAS